MTTYQKFRKLNMDFAAIGLELTGTEEKYFCRPSWALHPWRIRMHTCGNFRGPTTTGS